MRSTRVLAVLLLGASLLAACGDPDEEVETAPTTTAAASTTSAAPSTSAAPTTTVAPATTSAPTTTEGAPIETGIVLSSSGLTVVPFGASADNVLAALTDELGEPLGDEEAECPSGADRTVRFEDLLLVFSGGSFVGYTYGALPPGSAVELDLATTEGLVLGASEDELTSTYPGVTIAESSLGMEWTVEESRGYLGGLLGEDDGVVVAIWAGDICAFR